MKRFFKAKSQNFFTFLILRNNLSTLLMNRQPPIPIQLGFYLSPIEKTDKSAYLQHYADPSIANNLLMLPYPYTEDHADQWLDTREKNAKNPETFFAIRRSDGFLIGAIGTGFDGTNGEHTAEFGYWLCNEYRGRCLMPAVIQVFAKHCFTKLGVHRLQASIFSFNKSSGNALNKAGFTQEGLMRHYYKKGNEYLDAISYSLLKTDPIPTVVVKP